MNDHTLWNNVDMIEFAWNIPHLFQEVPTVCRRDDSKSFYGSCRVRTTLIFKKDDCLGLLIDIPQYNRPLYVSRAEVRWSDGQDFGMEFIQMEMEDQQRLGETVRAIEAATG